jgi:Cu(I)/Ag(I) efflux system membrane protein CusA/SilA
MTVIATLLGLAPIMLGHGTGAEVTQRIAAPMIGGIAGLLMLSLMVLPALYLLYHRAGIGRRAPGGRPAAASGAP